MTVWFDVEDIFHYAKLTTRPSGIQRLAFEIYNSLVTAGSMDVRFLRHDAAGRGFRTVSWEALRKTYLGMSHAEIARPPERPGRPRALLPPFVRPLAKRVPADIRLPFGQAVRAQLLVARLLLQGIAAIPRSLRPAGPESGEALAADKGGETLASIAKPGDCLCVFGSPWFHAEYHGLLERAKTELGVRIAILFYDLVPVIRPEFVIPAFTREFPIWTRNCLPLADRIFAISRATAADIESWADRTGLPIARPVVPVPIGTGFSNAPAQPRPNATPEIASKGDYVLFVSTIEPRKNHDLAFRVWRNLLTDLPPERVPTLVLAGRVGWMSQDFMARVENSRHLDGKLVVVEDPTDAQLTALYSNCRFTLFPSLYEGWGLPVTESLGFGKVCIASDRASVPEAGGAFCLYIDPDNVTAATAVIRRAIEDPAIVHALEARIRTHFRPVPWSETARALLEGL